MIIREIETADADRFVHLLQQVDRESAFMLWEAGERSLTVEQQKQTIESMHQSNNSTIFVAEVANQLIGYMMAIGGKARRNKHCAYIVVGIVEALYKKMGFEIEGVKRHSLMIDEKWVDEYYMSKLI